MLVNTKNKYKKIRFILVGSTNTAIDFGLLLFLRFIGVPVIAANILSTSAALSFSYFANNRFVFNSNDTNQARQIILFIVLTLFGLWALQTFVLILVSTLLSTYTNLHSAPILIVSKVIATTTSLVWNYFTYSRLIFREQTPR